MEVIEFDGKHLCVDCLQEALRKYGIPEIFNTDQGAQFTSAVFIGAQKEHPTISISMDGRGKALDNIFVGRLWRSVKHEDIYLNGYSIVAELRCGLKEYFVPLKSRGRISRWATVHQIRFTEQPLEAVQE